MRTAAAGEGDLGVRAQREGSRIVEGGLTTLHGARMARTTFKPHKPFDLNNITMCR